MSARSNPNQQVGQGSPRHDSEPRAQASDERPSLLAYCLMPNHWHLAVQAGPRTDLSTWMQRVTVTHTHRWHAHRHNAGEGPLYQGRFKSFPVQKDTHFLTLCRYIEANARRAKLVRRAENWQWSSLWARQLGRSELARWLREWPVDRPRNWVAEVNRRMDEEALEQVRKSVLRGIPLGTDSWASRIAARLGLNMTLRPRGRPRKEVENSVGVGTPVTRRPLHRSRRAALPHRAPALGRDDQSLQRWIRMYDSRVG